VRGILESAGRRFARLTTQVVVSRPALWGVFRGLMRRQFDSLAQSWESRIGAEGLVPLEAALARVTEAPRKALDLGTGTGKAARAVARRFPDTEVVGVDLSPEMIEQARRLLPDELAGRVSFAVADGAKLPFPDGAFDLVVLQNAFPFFSELGRVTAPGGRAIFAYSFGDDTPIWVPPETLRARLGEAGFHEFEELSAGEGAALLAARGKPG
jgi:SAM-dependent methyltransferase